MEKPRAGSSWGNGRGRPVTVNHWCLIPPLTLHGRGREETPAVRCTHCYFSPVVSDNVSLLEVKAIGPGDAGRPPKSLLGSKAFQHAVASADEPLSERGKCRLVLLGAGRHCSALCSPLHRLDAALGSLQPLTLSVSSCLRCLHAV